MKYAKLTRLSKEDLRQLRGSLRLDVDETMQNYFPEIRDENTRYMREKLNHLERLLKKVDAAEEALDERS